jgi:type III secretory pathway component EscR
MFPTLTSPRTAGAEDKQYKSARIFEMAASMHILTPENLETQQQEQNKKLKITINSSSIMRVKDADKLRQFLAKVERAREVKMQRFRDEGVKPEEIHKLS